MAPRRYLQILAVLIGGVLIGIVAAPASGHAERVGDLVTIGGAPANQLVGYGLVVGLPGTGDQTTQVPYTQQALTNMLSHEGITLAKTAFMQPNDVASVMVTAVVPPFGQVGSTLRATVAAVGNATSLAGGVLLATPLRGGNGLIYGQAQGSLLVSGFAAGASGSSLRSNTPTVGQVEGGAILSRPIPTESDEHGRMTLLLREPSFANAALIAEAINWHFGAGTATAVSPGVVTLADIDRRGGSVAFVATVLDTAITPARQAPTVVVDAQSGTIVMGAGVELGPAVVSHGNLTLQIQTVNSVSQPAPFSSGQTVGVQNSTITAQHPQSHVVSLPHATTLAQVARALNAIGATPEDLVAIVEALKEAGALKAHLKVI
jgi:flagellar P-ring protein FlgI